jgi:hypothetical protein
MILYRLQTWMFLTIVSVLLGGVSCNEGFCYDNTLLRGLPTRPKWRLKGKFRQAAVGKLNTNSVYIGFMHSNKEDMWHSKPADEFTFMRFWNDGHMMYRSLVMEKFPTNKDANSFYGTRPGYYVVHGDTLIIEYFGPGHYYWGYFYNKYKIFENKLVKIKREVGGDREVYKKFNLGSLTSNPDW